MAEKLNFSLVAFIAFTVRLVAIGASLPDAVAMFALAGLYGYSLYANSSRALPINEEVKTEIAELRAMISALKMQRTVGR